MKEKRRKWLGEMRCSFCRRELATFPWFVDGKTKRGPWAAMCPKCFYEHGTGLGIGRGQIYDGISGCYIGGGGA